MILGSWKLSRLDIPPCFYTSHWLRRGMLDMKWTMSLKGEGFVHIKASASYSGLLNS